MTLALAALVLTSLSPSTVVSQSALGQKIQIIKGGKKSVKAAPTTEATVQVVPQADTARARALDQQAAQLDAQSQDLAQREQALQEKEARDAEASQKSAEQKKLLQEKLQKLGAQNHEAWQNASNALAGDE